MEPVGDYVQQVHRLLSVGCALFPDEQPTTAVETAADSPLPSAPDATSGLAAPTQQANARYREVNARIAELTQSINQALEVAAAQALQAGIQARSIRDTAHSQAEAITTATTRSDGVGQLVSTMDERLAAMADHITSAREQQRATAAQIRALSVELSATSAMRD